LIANAKVLYGANRNLEIVTVGPDDKKKGGVALVEFVPDGRSFVHLFYPGGVGRVACMEQMLHMTEEKLQPMFNNLQASQCWLQPVNGASSGT
jgi:hypothetical protein